MAVGTGNTSGLLLNTMIHVRSDHVGGALHVM